MAGSEEQDLDNIVKKMVTKPTKDKALGEYYRKGAGASDLRFETYIRASLCTVFGIPSDIGDDWSGDLDRKHKRSLYQFQKQENRKEKWKCIYDYDGILQRIKQRFDFFMKITRELDAAETGNDLELSFNAFYGLDAHWVDRLINEEMSKYRNLLNVERLEEDYSKDKWDQISCENKANILKDLNCLHKKFGALSFLTHFNKGDDSYQFRQFEAKFKFRKSLINMNTLVYLSFADYEMRVIFEMLETIFEHLERMLFKLDKTDFTEKILMAYRRNVNEVPVEMESKYTPW